MKSVTLFVPTFNEIEGLRAVMPRIPRGCADQILIADGGSTDGTPEYARAQGWEVYEQKTPGLRHAYREAWPLVRGDLVITFSPDGNCLPEVMPQLVETVQKGFDMVVASRYLGTARSQDDDWMTGFGNWFFTRAINLLHGGSYTDAMGIYRAYRRDLFYELELDRDEAYPAERLFGTVAGIEPLLSIRALKKKMRITEIPADEPRRIGGIRKLQAFRWGAVYLLQIFRECEWGNG